MAKHDMKKAGYDDDQISQATSYYDTDDEQILALRKTYKRPPQKHKEAIKPEAEQVRAAGGLFIIGTERHESRRIDNQLRGRSGARATPARAAFYLSLEDDLLRLFGGDRIQSMMATLRWTRIPPSPPRCSPITSRAPRPRWRAATSPSVKMSSSSTMWPTASGRSSTSSASRSSTARTSPPSSPE